MSLEPRMLFDGAVAATALDTAATGATDTAAPPPADSPDSPAPATATSDSRQDVVFVDSQVRDYQQLLAGLPAGVEVVVLDPSQNGLQQMAAYLNGRSGIDSIQLLSHGSTGAFQAGNLWLDSQNLAEQAAVLGRIGTALAADGDLLIYGCQTGAGEAGAALLSELARLTQADVAASTDNTGAAQLGGDWELEVHQGVVETASLTGMEQYADLLASFTETFGSDPTGGAPVTSFTTTEGGVSYTYTFTGFGDGGDMVYDPGNGSGGSASIQPLSAGPNAGTTERITITRTDLADFTFTSLFINNQFGGQAITVGGYVNGVLVGSAQNMAANASGTLNFGGILVDEVRITSTDMNFNFDNFSGDTDPPLSAPSLTATGTNPSFTEGGSAVDLFSGVSAATNDSGQTFSGMTLTVTNVSNGASEILSIGGSDVALTNGNSGTIAGIGNYSVSVAGGTATVTLSGMTRSDAQMGTLIDGMTYRNTHDDPGTSNRVVTITSITDSGGNNNSATPNRVSTVGMTAVNDAPTLSATGNTPTFTEDGSAVDLFSGVSIGTVESGQTLTGLTLTVSNLADGSNEILNADGTAIALTNGNSGTTATNGMTYSVSVAGSTATVTLTKVAGISSAAAQTLVDGLSYRNASHAPDTTSRVITLTAISDNGGTSNGGVDSTSLSVAATVAIAAVNDAPTLSGGPYSLTGTDEDTTSSGTLVSTILAGLTHGDVDSGALSGIAITASTGNSTWQYSTDGVTWNSVGSVSSNAALLLSSSTRVRYVPDGANGETATLTFRAWDQTSGTASTNVIRNTADTSTNSGTTAFSSGTAQSSLTVSDVNDAPLLTPAAPSLTGITDGDTNNAGQTVASFVGTSIADVDSGAVEGIAITGLVSGTGTWQYSTDNGGSWSDVGSVSNGSALLLRATDKVRFVPDGVTGTVGSLTYHAWDQTGATAGQQGTKVDASSTGGSTPFSTATDTASITVSAVDDPATVTTSGGTTAFTEGNNVTSTPVLIDSGLTLSDSDSATLASATVSLTGNFQSGQDVLAFSNDGSTMGNISASYNAATGVLTLTSASATATVAEWQSALRSVTYSNSSDTPNTATRTLSFVVNDGNSDSGAATKSVSVASVNDAPVITLPGSIGVTEDAASALTSISFSDADAGGGSVTATFSLASGTLSASSGGGVTVGGSSTARTLTGTVANINAFIAGSNLTYTTAANATADVTLTVDIDDGGNTGSGGAQTDSETTTLQVSAVNDAPSITAPASIGVDEDVSTALTGISFSDVDAGSGSATVTLSVASGSLTSTSGSGVTVAGSGTGSLTLIGSIADINAFIAASQVSFQTAANATANVTLTVDIDDGGNTGSDPGNSGTASSEAAATTVTLMVTAVNDAPVNSVPGAQAVDQDSVLVFSSGNGNLVSISDVDAGGGTVRVTLTASNGLITLSGTAGLSFTVGSGASDGTMTFEGTLTNVNAVLNGLIFTPTPGYNGAASLQIVSNDLGLTGSGGAQTDSDTIAITVNSLNPEATSVQVTNADGGYKVGDVITVTVSFDQAVTVNTAGGTPTLLLETGATDRQATYVSGSGTDTLTFSYTVQAGDISADLDYQSTGALALNGATIRNATSDDAILTLPTVGGADSIAGQHDILIDGVVPSVTSVGVPANGIYVAGQNLDFSVNLSEAVVVDTSGGTPRIAVTLESGGTVFASYVSGSGTSSLVFRMTVASGQLDSNGIALASSIDLNGATVRDAVGNNAVTSLNGVASTSGVLVDAVVPTVASVSVPANGAYNAGEVLTFTLNTSEAVLVDTTGGTPRLALDLGGSTVYASYLSGSGSSALIFQYTVQAGDTDSDGIGVGSALNLNGATLRDSAGNNLALTLNGVGNTAGVIVDTTSPVASGLVRVDASPTNAGSVSYTLTFNEDVSGVDAADFGLVFSGTASGSIAGVTQVDAHTYRVLVGGLTGTGSVRLDLNSSGTGIQDVAGNALGGGLAGAVYSLDRDAPSVVSVSVPANGTYVAGQNLDFTVNFSEAVLVDTSGGAPRIAVTLDGGGTVYASYLAGSGSSALTFRLTVASGQLDSTGIGLASSLDLNGGSLGDALGNSSLTALNAVGSTAAVLVDAVAPVVASVSVPASAAYNAGDVLSFVVNTSEAVLLDTAAGSPRLTLDLGGTTVYADYVLGSGGSALVFRYTVQPGDNDSDGIALVGDLELNGATLRDAAGNPMALTLNGAASTAGVFIDTTPPAAGSLVRVDATPTSASSVRFTLTFSEAVSGVDAGDLALVTSGTASGVVQSVVQLDAQTYEVVVGGLSGVGSLGVNLNASGSGISDSAGNNLLQGLTGEAYSLVAAPIDGGDPEFRVTPSAPPIVLPPSTQPPPPLVPPPLFDSPLLPPPLFEIPTLGSGIPTLGNIFIHNGALAPSFLAQVFASSAAGGDGSGAGFLGFGGGDAGVFGSSSLSSIFSSAGPQEAEPLQIFDGKQWRGSAGSNDGLPGILGAPSLGRQLDELQDKEQRQIRDLAWALGQLEKTEPPA